MELKRLVVKILKLFNDHDEIERALIYSFAKHMQCDFKKSRFFSEYFSNVDDRLVEKITQFCDSSKIDFNIYSLIEIFELLIPEGEKKTNGMVYTPRDIKDYIIKAVINENKFPTICDPACGCGSFLLSAAEYLHNEYKYSYKEIFTFSIYGVDIIPHNIKKASILFRMLALTSGEIIEDEFNLIAADSLGVNWDSLFNGLSKDGFDIIIGNPPYVRAKNIQNDVKENLKKWETAKFGNVDLYIPFYELGLKLLKDSGKLGYISVNTYIKSLNGRSLRNYLLNLGSNIKIIDFKDAQIFKNVTSYTCITLIDKSKKDHNISYALHNGKSTLDNSNFTRLSYRSFQVNRPWQLGEVKINKAIDIIENAGVKLGSYKIRNGLATLKNDIFFFKQVSEDDSYYYREYNRKTYRIEKSICIDVIKPNIIKNELDLYESMEKGIFPYNTEGGIYKVITETQMKDFYPCTYEFLCQVKSTLQNRDKGKREYPEWYAYGRTQGMSNYGKKLLIPYISGEPIAVICERPEVLFYCGYAIFSEDMNELEVLKRILRSKIFWYYIKHTSKPYSKAYFSLAKNYIKEFGIPELSKNQKAKIISLKSEYEIDTYLEELYGVKV